MDDLNINWEKVLLCKVTERAELLIYIERLIKMKIDSESNGIESLKDF